MVELKITEVKLNPSNPRLIKDDKFKKLVQSIKDFPEMLKIRPIVVNQDMVILGGNMRYKACVEAGIKTIPVIITDLTEDKQKEFLIKDNVSGGEWDWDVLANEWDEVDLENWGLDLPIYDKIDDLEDGDNLEFEQSVQIIPPMEYILIMAEPNSLDWEEIKEKLQLKMVRRGGCVAGSNYENLGIERVITWDELKKRYVNSDTE
jgi:hypothetical protein